MRQICQSLLKVFFFVFFLFGLVRLPGHQRERKRADNGMWSGHATRMRRCQRDCCHSTKKEKKIREKRDKTHDQPCKTVRGLVPFFLSRFWPSPTDAHPQQDTTPTPPIGGVPRASLLACLSVHCGRLHSLPNQIQGDPSLAQTAQTIKRGRASTFSIILISRPRPLCRSPTRRHH